MTQLEFPFMKDTCLHWAAQYWCVVQPYLWLYRCDHCGKEQNLNLEYVAL